VTQAAASRGLDPARILRVESPEEGFAHAGTSIPVWQPTRDLALRDRKSGAPTRRSGAAQLAWIDAACDSVSAGRADALVTGPVSKEAIVLSGAPGSADFLGHTEHLQRRLGAREVVMAFWSPALVTSLATTHVSLARVPKAVTPALVARATYWLAWLLARLAQEGEPRVAVAALNPHAGEGGLLGREESTRIAPGIARARKRLEASGIRAKIDGPIAAESAFRLARERVWDGVVAMYHDQATIPMKLSGFGDAVNVSLGLPIIRTSVDHGTAYDRAGTGTADARGMKAAIALASRLGVG
jgi:4-hydroxythreonine-4-phosphate dehydrogenase